MSAVHALWLSVSHYPALSLPLVVVSGPLPIPCQTVLRPFHSMDPLHLQTTFTPQCAGPDQKVPGEPSGVVTGPRRPSLQPTTLSTGTTRYHQPSAGTQFRGNAVPG